MTTKTTEKEKTGAKIDKAVMKASKNNNLTLNQTALVDDIIKNISRDKKKTGARMYQDNLARQEVSTEVASVEFKTNLDKPKIQKALSEVLTDNDITKQSIIQEHKDILAQARSIDRVATARNCNKDFMELEGMTQQQPTIQNNIQINIDKLTTEQVNKELKDLISL